MRNIIDLAAAGAAKRDGLRLVAKIPTHVLKQWTGEATMKEYKKIKLYGKDKAWFEQSIAFKYEDRWYLAIPDEI